jgi:Major Facilitator Superfamily
VQLVPVDEATGGHVADLHVIGCLVEVVGDQPLHVRIAEALRVVLDRDRSGAYLSMLFVSAGLFGTFLFLTYYLQQTLGYSPLVTGVAFLPLSGGIIVAANLSTIVLMPRIGPRPLAAFWLLAAAGGAVWLAQLAPHAGYASGVLGPTIVSGIGMGMVFARRSTPARSAWPRRTRESPPRPSTSASSSAPRSAPRC